MRASNNCDGCRCLSMAATESIRGAKDAVLPAFFLDSNEFCPYVSLDDREF